MYCLYKSQHLQTFRTIQNNVMSVTTQGNFTELILLKLTVKGFKMKFNYFLQFEHQE